MALNMFFWFASGTCQFGGRYEASMPFVTRFAIVKSWVMFGANKDDKRGNFPGGRHRIRAIPQQAPRP